MAQFIFYMSWLKVSCIWENKKDFEMMFSQVGQSVANPFGEDDDDFDINTMIDNFVNVSES